MLIVMCDLCSEPGVTTFAHLARPRVGLHQRWAWVWTRPCMP